jgi:hypothetical protein
MKTNSVWLIRIRETLPRLAEALLYVVIMGVLALWCYEMRGEWERAQISFVVIVVYSLAIVSALLALYRIIVGPLLSEVTSAFFVVCLAMVSLEACLMATAEPMTADLCAALFLYAALLYRGRSWFWWLVLVPVAALSLFAPATWIERGANGSSTLLIRCLLPASLGLFAGALAASVRTTRAAANQALAVIRDLSTRQQALVGQLRELQLQLSEWADRRTESSDEMAFETFEIRPAVQTGAQDRLSYYDLIQIINDVLEKIRASQSVAANARILLTTPTENHWPHVIALSATCAHGVFDSLIVSGLEALGRSGGIVRITVRPTLAAIQVIVEDNGRGFRRDRSDLGSGQRWSDSVIRSELANFHASVDFNARLGVGSRVDLSFPRVDFPLRATTPRALFAQSRLSSQVVRRSSAEAIEDR